MTSVTHEPSECLPVASKASAHAVDEESNAVRDRPQEALAAPELSAERQREDTNTVGSSGTAIASSSADGAVEEMTLSLWDASRANPHAKTLAQLLEHGADVNARDANGWTPAHVAAYYGQEDVVDVLTRAPGVDMNARNKHGETPLHLAAKWPHDKAAELLCKAGADPNARNKRGRTPLHTAALFARRTVLEKLIAAGGDVNAADDEQNTPLHLAARPHAVVEMDLIMLVIRSGANLEAQDKEGRVPLATLPKPQLLVHFAAAEGQTNLMKQLLLMGCTVEELNQEGMTPLQTASLRGDLPLVKLLLAHGAKPNVAAAKGRTGDLAVGTAPGGVKLTTKQLVGDRTALHFAAEKGNAEVLTALVAAGAKVNQPSVCGMTALHLAVWHQHAEAAKALMQSKADVHARVKTNGMTPLHYVAFNTLGKREVARLLIEKGADIEARTQEGWTPLHLAAAAGSLEVVHELLSHGARITAKGRKGQTALECAKRRPEVMALLNAASGGKRALLPLLPVVDVDGEGSSGSGEVGITVTSPPPLTGMPDPLLALPPSQQQQQQLRAAGRQLASSDAAAAAVLGVARSSGTAGVAHSSAASDQAGALGGPRHTPEPGPLGAVGKQARPQAALQPSLPSTSTSSGTGAGAGLSAGAAGSSQALGGGGVPTLSLPLGTTAGLNVTTSPQQALSSLLKTLQNCNVSVPGAVAAATIGGEGGGPPLPHLPPGTTHLARISATGPSAPQLLAQLQEALSSAMKTHGLESCNSSLTLGEHGQCSLQPGQVFGENKCLQAPVLKQASEGSAPGTSKLAEEKLLYMYCSNNCGFQFHASCWKVAKERLKHLYPKFTGFSASRGDSSLLPCLSGNCNGVIDEVFMGTPQSCTELYRMTPPAQPSSPHPDSQQQGGQGAPVSGGQGQGSGQAAHQVPLGARDRHLDIQRPWQELLVKGDKLLKELEENVNGHRGHGGEQGRAKAAALVSAAKRHLQGQAASAGSMGQAAGTQVDAMSNSIQDVIARTVVSSAADMVDALSKLADVLGSGAGGGVVPGIVASGSGASAGAGTSSGNGPVASPVASSSGASSGAGVSGSGGLPRGKAKDVSEREREAELNAALLPTLIAMGRAPPPAYASPPPCDPIPDDPSPVPSESEEDAGKQGLASAAALRAAGTEAAASAAETATAGGKKGKKKGKGGGGGSQVAVDLPDWVLEDMQAASMAATAKAKKGKQQQQQKQQQKQKQQAPIQQQESSSAASSAAVTSSASEAAAAGSGKVEAGAFGSQVGEPAAAPIGKKARAGGKGAGAGAGASNGGEGMAVNGRPVLSRKPGVPADGSNVSGQPVAGAEAEGEARKGEGAVPSPSGSAQGVAAAAEGGKKKKKKQQAASAASGSGPVSSSGAGSASQAFSKTPAASGAATSKGSSGSARLGSGNAADPAAGSGAGGLTVALPDAPSVAAAAAVEALKSMLPGYSTRAVADAVAAAGGDLNAAADLLLAGTRGGSGGTSPSSKDSDSNPWLIAGQPAPRPPPPAPVRPSTTAALAPAPQGRGARASNQGGAAAPAAPGSETGSAVPEPGAGVAGPKVQAPAASSGPAGRRSASGSGDVHQAAHTAAHHPSVEKPAARPQGPAAKDHSAVLPPPPPPPFQPKRQQQLASQAQPSAPHLVPQPPAPALRQAAPMPRAAIAGKHSPPVQVELSPFISESAAPSPSPHGVQASHQAAQRGPVSLANPSPLPPPPPPLEHFQQHSAHMPSNHRSPHQQQPVMPAHAQHAQHAQDQQHTWLRGLRLEEGDAHHPVLQQQHPQLLSPSSLGQQPPVLLPSSLLDSHPSAAIAGPSTSLAGVAVNGQWQHAAAAWQQLPATQARAPLHSGMLSPKPSTPGAGSAGLGGASAAAAPSQADDDGYDDWAQLQEAMQAVAADSSSLMCLPTPQAFTAEGAAAAAAAAAEAMQLGAGAGPVVGTASAAAMLPPGSAAQGGPRLSGTSSVPLAASGLYAGPTLAPLSPGAGYPPHLQQQQLLVQQQAAAAAAAAAAATAVRQQHHLMQQQQQQQQGHLASHLGPTPTLQLSGDALVSTALSDMKCTNGQASQHLLLECPDIPFLMSQAPSMVETWIRDNVARFGSIACWRVMGPYGALALSLDTVQSALSAVMGLNGRTMVMKPVIASLLADFPDNEQLAGHAHQVAARAVGPGSVFNDAMRGCLKKLQELPPPEPRNPVQLLPLGLQQQQRQVQRSF